MKKIPLLSLVCALMLGLPLAGQTQGLLDWQPCPDLLAKTDAPEPAEGQRWTFSFSPLVVHWVYDPAHKDAIVSALERSLPGNRFCGLSLFRNSFGQASAYVYAGQRWDQIFGHPQLSFKISAGIIYGYTGDESDKVPLNWNGFSPAIIPSLVYQFSTHDSVDIMILGTAGAVFAFSHNF